MKNIFLALPLLCLLTTACNADSSSQKNHATAKQSASSTPLNDVKKGMAYADFRQAVLTWGWTPEVDPQCKANVVGRDYKKQCATDPDMCKQCDEMPELSACSGDAVCVMHFRQAGTVQNMEVSTYGEIRDWDVHGKDSQLGVTGWTTTPAAHH